jgi:hypothetical protein
MSTIRPQALDQFNVVQKKQLAASSSYVSEDLHVDACAAYDNSDAIEELKSALRNCDVDPSSTIGELILRETEAFASKVYTA